MNLQDLRVEDFDFSGSAVPKSASIPEYTDFEGGSYTVISKVAFLAGVDKKHFENEHEPPKMEWFNYLTGDKNARIVRNLCRLRNAIERNYKAIYTAMNTDMKNLHTLPQYVPQDAIAELEQDGIDIIKANNKLINYIIEINKLISNRINNCKMLFPIWLKWDYIRSIFIMPNGTTENGAKKAAEEYYANRQDYPYQVYMNLAIYGKGNILYNDKKFVVMLYEYNEDYFWDISKVTDAGNVTKNGIYSFLENSTRTVAVVDCENSDPYKVYAMLTNLNQEALLEKVCKIILYDDEHTSSAWGLLNEFTDIEVEHKLIKRIKEDKSLVDASLMLGAAKEFYKNDVDSFILLSSDSDYWSLIRDLEGARFFVMVESQKCGPDIKRELLNSGVSFCYLDDFCTGDSGIVIRTLLSEVRARVEASISMNINRILEDAIFETRACISKAERNQFYERYIKKMKLEIDPDGEVRIVLGDAPYCTAVRNSNVA